MTERRLLSGDEAVALAARDAGVAPRHRLPRHALHRDPRGLRRPRRPGPVGAQREGGARGRARRRLRRRPRARHHEARRPQRRRRPALHRRLHRRHRRPGGRLRRRPGHGLQPERAGQPPLRRRRRRCPCSSRPTPQEAYDFLLARHRALRALADPGAPPHDHAGLPLEDAGRLARRPAPAPRRARASSATSRAGS